VGVQISGQAEQPRVLLVSAPYALKAGDAETIGGLPPSAFVLAAPTAISSAAASSTAETVSPLTATDVTTTGGKADYLPIFNAASTIIDSVLYQTGTGSTAKVGLNTTTPATTLDVNGAGTVRGTLSLPATAAATATAGKDSQALNLVASAFNGPTTSAFAQTFQLRAEPVGNDTATPSGALSLLYGSGTAVPAETGLHIASNGRITFATGQTFPGTGDGTVTSVATGLGLKGGPITKTGTLTIDTTVVPQLAVANKFTANQTVSGSVTATSSASSSIVGNTSDSAGTGVIGNATASSGGTTGVLGEASATSAVGVKGYASAATGNTVGVWGVALSPGGWGVYGKGATGVVALATWVTGPGGSFTGFSAASSSGQSGTDGVDSTGGRGDVNLGSSTGGVGVMGTGGFGGNDGGAGGSFSGGVGNMAAYGDGIDATNIGGGTFSETQAYAGNFTGDINVTGKIYAGTKDFKIDHPLDPANKYLFHASVESSEMMNIYTGNITTDSEGHATVQLPEWFQVLNTDFRYQLTVIGQFAQAIVAREIENNRFEVRTNAPNVKVSWQVTGVRQDAYAKANPLVVEQEKGARLRGFYIHPELYGAPPEKQIEWARHPQMMKRIKEMQAKQQATVRAAAQPAAAQPK